MSSVLGHASGSRSVVENTVFSIASRPVKVSVSSEEKSLWLSAEPDNANHPRLVLAPITSRYLLSGCSSSQVRYSGPSGPHQPGQPLTAAYSSRDKMKLASSSCGESDMGSPLL